MSSFYNRRPSYVSASWTSQRLYPRQEPTAEHFNLSPSVSRPAEDGIPSLPTTTETPVVPISAPAPPPPMYFPGEAQLARTRSARRGINAASSKQANVIWESFPVYQSGWKRYLGRPVNWWKCLKRREKEVLWDGFPVEFGGPSMANCLAGRGDEEDGFGRRSLSRSVSAPDSGIGLTPRSTMEPQHPLAGIFKERIGIVNETMAKYLVPTRVILAVLEIVDVAFVILLILALGIDKGKQKIFLEAVEVTLVVLIIANGALVNSVRMKRWALAKQLRTLSRDWSPLPITTSTNAALLNNAELGNVEILNNPEILDNGDTNREGMREREELGRRSKDLPTMRWSMRRTEGSWWLSYRPIVKVELVTPSAYSYNQLSRQFSAQQQSGRDGEGIGEVEGEGEVPAYVA